MHALTVISSAPLLAHQGGWDELLMVIVPVSAFAAMLFGANRRASRLEHREPSESAAPRNERGGPS